MTRERDGQVEGGALFGERWYRDYQQLYAFLLGLVEAGKLGGGRFTATGGD